MLTRLVHYFTEGYARRMIGKLTGKIAGKSPEGVLIDVNGVGYDVVLPLGTLAGLPPTGTEISLSIHTNVREDELRLFGFATQGDRAAFRTMIKVSGVGPKLAVAVLGALSGDQLASAVNEGDTRRLTAIPGIGKKTAERMILELGGKLTPGKGASSDSPVGVLGELSSALVNLGFKQARVDKAIAAIEKSGDVNRPFEDMLREGLAALRERG